jgi:hypothetical protein
LKDLELRKEISRQIIVAFSVYPTQLSPEAIAIWIDHLVGYDAELIQEGFRLYEVANSREAIPKPGKVLEFVRQAEISRARRQREDAVKQLNQHSQHLDPDTVANARSMDIVPAWRMHRGQPAWRWAMLEDVEAIGDFHALPGQGRTIRDFIRERRSREEQDERLPPPSENDDACLESYQHNGRWYVRASRGARKSILEQYAKKRL